jgi:hypothetical protein
MWCGTFHALGARMLRGVAPIVGREQNFTIYDEDDTIGAVKRVMERRRLSPTQFAPKAILSAISSAKNALVSPGEYARSARDTFTTAVAGVYTDLESALQQANAVTFDDLLVLPVRALERDDALRAHYQRRFRYIMVDEYQDTNAAQYRFIQLMGGGHKNVMVVGDDDQSIYGWRGADIRNILEFEEGFPGARIVRLELTDRLREKLGQAYSPSAGSSLSHYYPGYGTFAISTAVAADKVGATRAAIDELVADLRKAPLDADVIERARKPYLEEYNNTLKDLGGWLALAARAQSEPERLDRYFAADEVMAAITPEEVHQTALRYLVPGGSVAFVVIPEKPTKAAPKAP